MINLNNKKQPIGLSIIFATVGIITAIVGVLAYRNNTKQQLIQKEVLEIDREIKLLQLAQERKKQK